MPSVTKGSAALVSSLTTVNEIDEQQNLVRGQLMACIALVPIVVWMWLAMVLFHEMGHVLAAWATGGSIVSLELRPGRLSHALVQPPVAQALCCGAVLSLDGWHPK